METNSKMAGLTLAPSITAININGLNASVKKQKSDLKNKYLPPYLKLFNIKNKLKVKR